MLESILDPKKAKNNPLEVLVVTVVLSCAAIMFSYFLFPEYSSVLAPAFITVLFAPFFQRLFACEEEEEGYFLKHHTDRNIFQRHEHVIKIYSAYFLGLIILMSLLFVLLPTGVKAYVFQKQISEVERLSGMSVSGMFVSPQGAQMIFANNIFVMLLAFISSFLFGTGAVFILSWNASVIGVYVGGYVGSLIAGGMLPLLAYAYGMPHAIFSITLHGVPEVFGYFFAGMAGGILSIGLVKEKIKSPEMKLVFKDSLLFLGFGLFSIFVGSFIEVGSMLFSSIAFAAYIIFLSTLLIYSRHEK